MNVLASSRSALLVLALGSLLSACESNPQSQNDATDKNGDDKRVVTIQVHPEYAAFRKSAIDKIEANEERIAELKSKLAETGGDAPLDNMRANRIETLQAKNADLRLRLITYEKEPSDWEKFKSEFNHDLNSFEEAFKDLGSDNVNK
ncbi:MAG: hypothetical protein GC205_00505 [Bacteroidetes bacterium]|nr:hypothetical protein [Bacteroidota bacterium]